MVKPERDPINMNLLDEFITHNNRKKLFSKKDRILVACSGGRDSVVMAHVLYRAGYQIGLAYIDHQTRNGDSLIDGLFVARLASKWSVPFYYRKFLFEPKPQNSNFQNQARTFRYMVLQEILADENYSKIATAHHQQDVVESFFINLSKKAGLEGLLGIEFDKKNVVRPLLHFNNEQIESYKIKEKIRHITDSSNLENKYKRNKLRNLVIPSFSQWDKGFIHSTNVSIDYLREANLWIENEVRLWIKNHIQDKDNELIIPLKKLKKHHSAKQLLFRILKGKGFNMTQINEILEAEDSGKTWLSSNQQINLFRSNLYVSPLKIERDSSLILYPFEDVQSANLGFISLHQTRPKNSESRLIDVSKSMQNSKLAFRKWKSGDYVKFSYGKKKLKNFFLEQKVPSHKRRELWLLAYGQEILWIENITLQKSLLEEELFFIELLKKN